MPGITDIAIERVESPDGRQAICLDILRALPDWFGNAEAVIDYGQQCRALPVFAAFAPGDNASPRGAVGFSALKQHNAFTSEICVMGVKPAFHHKGIGSSLLAACEDACRAGGVRFLTVKTLADTVPDESYAATRAFYRAMGFMPLEVFPLHWDEANPCLLMVKAI